MAHLETFSSYFSRLVTFQDFLWIGFIWLLGFLVRKRPSKRLAISTRRYLLIALSFTGLICLRLRFWVATGTFSEFWLVSPEVLAQGFHVNANLLLTECLYMPSAALLLLANKTWRKLALFFP
jgi:hypothetical protein